MKIGLQTHGSNRETTQRISTIEDNFSSTKMDILITIVITVVLIIQVRLIEVIRLVEDSPPGATIVFVSFFHHRHRLT